MEHTVNIRAFSFIPVRSCLLTAKVTGHILTLSLCYEGTYLSISYFSLSLLTTAKAMKQKSYKIIVMAIAHA